MSWWETLNKLHGTFGEGPVGHSHHDGLSGLSAGTGTAVSREKFCGGRDEADPTAPHPTHHKGPFASHSCPTGIFSAPSYSALHFPTAPALEPKGCHPLLCLGPGLLPERHYPCGINSNTVKNKAGNQPSMLQNIPRAILHCPSSTRSRDCHFTTTRLLTNPATSRGGSYVH